jgi:hypothetical protein
MSWCKPVAFCTWASTCGHTPAWRQRRNRAYTVCQGPNRSTGKSRQDTSQRAGPPEHGFHKQARVFGRRTRRTFLARQQRRKPRPLRIGQQAAVFMHAQRSTLTVNTPRLVLSDPSSWGSLGSSGFCSRAGSYATSSRYLGEQTQQQRQGK